VVWPHRKERNKGGRDHHETVYVLLRVPRVAKNTKFSAGGLEGRILFFRSNKVTLLKRAGPVKRQTVPGSLIKEPDYFSRRVRKDVSQKRGDRVG